MKLRIIAILVWPLAIVFTLFVAPSLESGELSELVTNHQSKTVTVQVISESSQVSGFGGSKSNQAIVRIEKPASLQGKQGILQSTEESFVKGDLITGVLTFRVSHRSDYSFKATLKHLRSVRHASAEDVFTNIRRSFLSNLRGVDSDSAALVAGLAIGDESRLSAKTKENFKVVSLTHLTAVSGANCAIVLSALALLLLRIPISRRIRIALSLIAIVGYLALVGPQPSVIRASVMVGIVLLGKFFGRKVLAIDAISVSVILILLFEPRLSLDYGFALSVLATLGLLVLAPKLIERFSRVMPTWLSMLVAVTVAAQIACLPVLLLLQPKFPLYSVLANLLAEPMVVPVTVLGLLACLSAPIFPVLSGAISYLASWPASWIISVANWLSDQPLASINWFEGAVGVLLAILVTISVSLLLLSSNKKLKVSASTILLLISFSFISQNASVALTQSAFYRGNYTLVNCDVGQGDALVIRSKGKVAVIDVGREDPAIDTCLNSLNIKRIDLLVLTHFDMDHIGGLLGTITGRQVNLALLSSFKDDRPGADFAQQVLVERKVSVILAEKGMTGHLGDFDWTVLSPHRGAPEAEDSNDGSISMYWQDREIALFTLADLGERGQLRVGQEQAVFLNSGFGGRTVVVKVAHHGSADQAAEFYEAVAADVAIISVGNHNSYGHPTNRLLGILASTGSQILRTDEQGAVGLSETEAGLTASVSGRS